MDVLEMELHVLLVEDDDEDAELFKAKIDLSLKNYKLTWAKSLEEGLEKIRKYSDEIDVIALDLKLPDSTDCDNTVRSVINECGTIPVCVFTAQDDIESSLRYIEMGAQDYISKSSPSTEISRLLLYPIKRKELEEKIQSQVELRQEINYILAHDLRAPISSIKSFLEIFIDDNKTEDSLILRSYELSRFALDFMQDLLKSSLKDTNFNLSLSKNNLLEIINKALQSYEHQLNEKNIKSELVIDESIILNVDKYKFIQVFMNLIGNSVKFLDNNGKISIEANHSSSNNNLEILFKDNGPGINEDDLPKIFEKYKQSETKHKKKGIGLGLSICKQIIELHGGSISCHSKLNHGVEFLITLQS